MKAAMTESGVEEMEENGQCYYYQYDNKIERYSIAYVFQGHKSCIYCIY
jgi:hypothetical protein